MTSGTFSYPSQRNTGYKVTAEDWNELVDDINFIGSANSFFINDYYFLTGYSGGSLTLTNIGNNDAPKRVAFRRITNNTETMVFGFSLPKNYGGSPSISFGLDNVNGTSGNAIIGVRSYAFSEFGTALPGTSDWSSNNYGTFSVPGTVRTIYGGTIDVPSVGFEKNKYINVELSFIGTSGGSFAGTAYVYGVKFNYQS